MKSGHIPELDGVRGLACLGVLFAHCIVGPFEPPVAGLDGIALYLRQARAYILPHLLGGVDLFFVLSGFLIGGILIDNRRSPNLFKAFWARRAARILPVAWFLFLTYAIALAIRAHFDLSSWDIWLLAEPRPPIFSYATFTQNFFIALSGVEQPRWIAITWSLAIEEQFYLLFPFIVYLLRPRLLYLVVACGVVLAIALRAPLESYFGNWYAPYILLVTRMDALLLGVLVALVVRNSRLLAIARNWRYAFDVAILIAAYLIARNHKWLHFWPFADRPVTSGPFPPLKHTVLALMYALCILRIFLYESGPFRAMLRSTVLGWFGLISYALYMYHQSINGVMHAAFFGDQPKVNSLEQLGVAIAVMAMAIALSYLSLVWLEMPIRRIGQRVRYGAPGATGRTPLDPVTAGGAHIRTR